MLVEHRLDVRKIIRRGNHDAAARQDRFGYEGRDRAGSFPLDRFLEFGGQALSEGLSLSPGWPSR